MLFEKIFTCYLEKCVLLNIAGVYRGRFNAYRFNVVSIVKTY